MRVKFTGYVEIEDRDIDGDMDWAVMNEIHLAGNSFNAADFYSQLELNWEVVNEQDHTRR